jgi:hypothetical protein
VILADKVGFGFVAGAGTTASKECVFHRFPS